MITAFWITLNVLAASPEAVRLFDEANKAYQEGQFEKAAEDYKELNAMQEIQSPALLYNLANALYRQGHLGGAILYYEAALVLNPDFEPARKNLEKTLGETKRSLPLPDIREVNSNPVLRYYPLSPGHSLWLVHAALVAAIALLAVRYWRKHPRYTWAMRVALVLAAVFYGLTLAAGNAARTAPKVAVAQAKEVPVYFSTSETEQPRFLLYEGDRVYVDRMEGDWVRVHAYGGERGWTRKDNVGMVEYGTW